MNADNTKDSREEPQEKNPWLFLFVVAFDLIRAHQRSSAAQFTHA
jgi:hypothetical protein